MQELVLIQPGGTADRFTVAHDNGRFAVAHEKEDELAREAAPADTRREFEERLAECGPLAFRRGSRRVAQHRRRRGCGPGSFAARLSPIRSPAHRNRFRAWLVRIAFRLALDRLRSGKRREQRDTLWSQPEHQPPTANAEDLAAWSEFQAHLEDALVELPEKLRLVLMLAAMEGYTTDEVAALVGIPVGTVKTRIFHARRQLAEKLRCYANAIKRR